MATAPADQAQLLEPAYRRRFIALMFLVCLFDFADRAVFAVLAQPIKEELLLTDFQIGMLQGLAFAALYAGLALPLARLAERASRRNIVAICTAVWSTATIWCGFATSFATLAIGRIGVGVGEAGFLPATNSMTGDLVPRHRRASTMALIMLGAPAGIFLGAMVGGYVAGLASWREAFLVLGLPGLTVAIMVRLFVREPRRGLVDNVPPDPSPPPDFKAFLKTLRRKPALIFILLGSTTASFGITAISQFLAIFLARVHEMDVPDAGALYGTISGIYIALSLLIGSFGTDWLSKRDGRWPAWGAAIGLLSAPFLYYLAFNAQDIGAATALLIVSGVMLMLFYGPSAGMIQNLLEPRMRATGIALFTLFYSLIGYGLGPVFVGFVSDRMAVSAYGPGFFADCPGGVAPEGASAALASACASASADGVQQALLVAICVFFVAALFFLLASRTLREDAYIPEAANEGAAT
ncbi:spinster family MFS transporter [Parasphingopyxis marina]|uniref:MFS transporter n=1 Tax=Parasphingopyxis marina TaxID=2761622 RepID=A0A842HUN2_9SPHN|nr:MFS transporter [Parasphingopyxis marina]MBC2776776.1 MFS transporter [Parasphingopyxis marina]